MIEAPAGNVSLEAKTGDLDINSGSLISSAGISKQFFDRHRICSGRRDHADCGCRHHRIYCRARRWISPAPPTTTGFLSGGAAGSLTLSAPVQVVNLSGTLKGEAASGYLGGSFSL